MKRANFDEPSRDLSPLSHNREWDRLRNDPVTTSPPAGDPYGNQITEIFNLTYDMQAQGFKPHEILRALADKLIPMFDAVKNNGWNEAIELPAEAADEDRKISQAEYWRSLKK